MAEVNSFHADSNLNVWGIAMKATLGAPLELTLLKLPDMCWCSSALGSALQNSLSRSASNMSVIGTLVGALMLLLQQSTGFLLRTKNNT